MDKNGKKKFPTKADWIGMIVGFFPAALIVSSDLRIGGLWVALIAVGGYYGARAIAQRFVK